MSAGKISKFEEVCLWLLENYGHFKKIYVVHEANEKMQQIRSNFHGPLVQNRTTNQLEPRIRMGCGVIYEEPANFGSVLQRMCIDQNLSHKVGINVDHDAILQDIAKLFDEGDEKGVSCKETNQDAVLDDVLASFIRDRQKGSLMFSSVVLIGFLVTAMLVMGHGAGRN